MKSINKINGQLNNNATIQRYFELGAGANYYHAWQNKSFEFILSGRKYHLSILGNFIYGAAKKEFSLITGLSRNYDYNGTTKRINYTVEHNGNKLNFDVIATIDINGVTLVIHNTNFKEAAKFKRFVIRSNDTWQNFDLKKYFETKILPQYLYAPGLFRNMQIVYNISKKEVPAKYKWMREVFNRPTEIDEQKAWKQLFKNRFNVLLTDYFSDAKINHMLNTFTWQRKRSKVVNSPSMFELYDHCTSVADTEEGMIEEFDNVMSEYKNTILV